MGAERKRWPKGYVGRNHETIGSDVLAVLKSLQQLVGDGDGAAGQRMAQQVIGQVDLARLQSLDANAWVPIGWLLDLMDSVEAKIGRFGLIKMGRTLFRMSHEQRVVQVAKSAWDIVNGFDAIYRHANRGDRIGGWRVLSFEGDRAEIEKTTPHHCAMEEGIFAQALQAVGAPAMVTQSQCFRQGADACHFVILASSAEGRWRP
jgi:hypothetical protein